MALLPHPCHRPAQKYPADFSGYGLAALLLENAPGEGQAGAPAPPTTEALLGPAGRVLFEARAEPAAEPRARLSSSQNTASPLRTVTRASISTPQEMGIWGKEEEIKAVLEKKHSVIVNRIFLLAGGSGARRSSPVLGRRPRSARLNDGER